MKIHTYSLGELQANCYLLENDGSAIIIDPADDASFLLEELQRKGLKLETLFATHGHFDHCGAGGEIQMSFDVPFYLHKKDQFLIERLESTAKYFLGYKPFIIPPKNITYIPSKKFQVSSFELQVIETPGHTPGGVCYYFPDEQTIFTGDTLFAGAVGRTNLSYSSKKDLWNSLKKILALPEETIVYPGHGEFTYIGKEKYLLG